MANGMNSNSSAGNVSPAVVATVVETYYSDLIRSSTSARARAQAAQSGAAILMAAIIGTFSLANINEAATITKLLTLAATFAWAVAAMLYVRATGSPVVVQQSASGVNSDDQLVRTIIDAARGERERIDRRQTTANLSSIVAIVLTLCAFGFALLTPRPEPLAALLTPSSSDKAIIQQQCGVSSWPVRATVEKSTLNDLVMSVSIPCGNEVRSYMLRTDSLEQFVGESSS